MNKLLMFVLLYVCVENSLISSIKKWPAIRIEMEEVDNLVNNNDALEAYLKAGGNPNIYCLLEKFVYRNNLAMVVRLLDAGADIDLAYALESLDHSNRILGYTPSPLQRAVQKESIEMVQLLVERGANLYKEDYYNGQNAIDVAKAKVKSEPENLTRIEIEKYLDKIASEKKCT